MPCGQFACLGVQAALRSIPWSEHPRETAGKGTNLPGSSETSELFSLWPFQWLELLLMLVCKISRVSAAGGVSPVLPLIWFHGSTRGFGRPLAIGPSAALSPLPG
ncbi:heat-stable enterotoxin receptor-like [Platysternon megacephalum]|uniref:Heat-stable enterotoxin receptor-like n=1 Tax=Platysternon megacephalum TaxID=55544 RepID=A0A4D9DIV2_9SAUR|nr:heat-stable enterotoxin receptor-like [Platysternon megacephalum]